MGRLRLLKTGVKSWSPQRSRNLRAWGPQLPSPVRHFADRPVSTILTFEARNGTWRSPLTRSEFSSACKCVRGTDSQVGPRKIPRSQGTELRDQMDFWKSLLIRWKGTGPIGETSFPSSCNEYSKHDKWRGRFRTQISTPNTGFMGPHKGRRRGQQAYLESCTRPSPASPSLLSQWGFQAWRSVTEHRHHLVCVGLTAQAIAEWLTVPHEPQLS